MGELAPGECLLPDDSAASDSGAGAAGTFGGPDRSARCRRRHRPWAKRAARQCSRVSSIVVLAFVGGLRAPHGHREPRFRDNLKALLAKRDNLADFGRMDATAVTNHPFRKDGSDLATPLVGCQISRAARSARRHELGTIAKRPVCMDARCALSWVIYAGRAWCCALNGEFPRFSKCHTLCGIATRVVTPRLRREDITRRSRLVPVSFLRPIRKPQHSSYARSP